MAARFEPAIDRFGLFLIVAVCLAADRLPKKHSRVPIDRAAGYAAAAVIGAVGVLGWLIDWFYSVDRREVIRRGARQPDPRASRAGLG